ncbi:MAG: RHS repeat-associated core domain-containing protein [Candidatus Methylacidiphilales bacterium]
MSLSGNKLNVSGTNTQVGTLFNTEGEAGRIFKVDFDLTIGSGISQVWFETNASYNSTGGGLRQNITNSSSSGHVSFTFTAPQGAYRFKFGNIGTGTFSIDNLIVKEVGPGRYQAEIVTANDYSPFGAPMPGRSFKADNVLVKTTLSTSNFTTGTDGWVATTNATLSNVFGNIRATVTAVNAGMKKTFSTEPGKTYRVMFKINLRGWPYMYIKDKYTNTNLLSITNYIVPGDASYTFTATGYETDVIFNEATNPAGSIQLANFTLEEVEANSGYRFAFNGKERDNETYGEGNAYDFGARIYDPRLGRWLSIDPKYKFYPEYSPYNFALNNPIVFIDFGGEAVNGGFSVTNQSNKPIVIIGTSLTTRDAGVFSKETSIESDQVPRTLMPGQRFEATYNTFVRDGVTIEEFNGRIVDVKTGKVIADNIGIYDVDFIKIQDGQKFEDDKGKIYTNKNTNLVPNGQGEIKLGSPLMDAALQNGAGFDPDPDEINEGNVNIKNNSKGNLQLETTGESENTPNITYGSSKKEVPKKTEPSPKKSAPSPIKTSPTPKKTKGR